MTPMMATTTISSSKVEASSSQRTLRNGLDVCPCSAAAGKSRGDRRRARPAPCRHPTAGKKSVLLIASRSLGIPTFRIRDHRRRLARHRVRSDRSTARRSSALNEYARRVADVHAGVRPRRARRARRQVTSATITEPFTTTASPTTCSSELMNRCTKSARPSFCPPFCSFMFVNAVEHVRS